MERNDSGDGDRFLIPLIIPAIFLAGAVVAAVVRGRHVVNSNLVTELLGALGIALLVAVPSFRAGVLYREARARSDQGSADLT
jgi:hypothetical protein